MIGELDNDAAHGLLTLILMAIVDEVEIHVEEHRVEQ